MQRADLNTWIAAQLRQLGLDVFVADQPNPSTFLPGVWIEHGVVYVHPPAAHPGDLLHEAGHLAVIPSRFRPSADGMLFDPEGSCGCMTAIDDYLHSAEAYRLGPDHWLCRAALNCGEMEAVAWGYAVAAKIGVPTLQVFTYEQVPDDAPYNGDGLEIHELLRQGRHPGIHGLQAAGMCRIRKLPDQEGPFWPEMLRWTQA